MKYDDLICELSYAFLRVQMEGFICDRNVFVAKIVPQMFVYANTILT